MNEMNRWKQVLASALGVVLLAMVVTTPVWATEPTAREVMEMVDNRDDGETSISELTMVLIDRRNNQRVRQLKGYRKDFGKDTRTINFFISPADVQNTSFLSYEWDDPNKEDDNWLYLPALRKVKRISSGNKKDSFMGSDFTYADMNGLELTEWDFKFDDKKSVKVNGQDCWVILAEPKTSIKTKVINETGYTKIQYWVQKDILIGVRSKLWEKKGNKVKYFSASEIEKIDGIWTAKKLTMVTKKGNRQEHATVLIFNGIIYNQGMSDDMFSTQRMERGL
ncbi:MAG: outer membrane lipoprotein-sorting protein [SAR324 cluster bacterium]|nr:outer membrane lipoprotein-sorting protein [SAR324 cluster bacterium]